MHNPSGPAEFIKVEPDHIAFAADSPSPFLCLTTPCSSTDPELVPLLLSPFSEIISRKRAYSVADGPNKRRPPLDGIHAVDAEPYQTSNVGPGTMTDPYITGAWSPSQGRDVDQSQYTQMPFPTRRSSDGDQSHQSQAFPHDFELDDDPMSRRGTYRVDGQPNSTNSSPGSSSLSGAMGPSSPSSSSDGALYNPELRMHWPEGLNMQSSMAGSHERALPLALPSRQMMANTTAMMPYQDFNSPTYIGALPNSNSPHTQTLQLPAYPLPGNLRLPQERPPVHNASPRTPLVASVQPYINTSGTNDMASMQSPASARTDGGAGYIGRSSPEGAEDEATRLRARVRDLEVSNAFFQHRVAQLENERRSGGAENRPAPISHIVASRASLSPDFRASWEARTELRIKRFCSLNRAGNALCAWHDSRRERRTFPPRLAPRGFLNCGCTVEQALFEESLSRHGVGSYHPGDSVRMDPALRNPLLALLQARYGYRDGDFERDPETGRWVEGEGPALWEAPLQATGRPGGRRDSQR